MSHKKVGVSNRKIKNDPVHLRRQIGLLPAISLIVGTMVGSGIFISPKGVLMYTGSVGLSLVLWGVSGFISLLGGLCYAELGTTFTKSGGTYTYLMETLGPFPAFLKLWNLLIFSTPASTSFMSLAFARYALEPLFSPCDPPLLVIKLLSVVGVTFIIGINCWSVNIASNAQVTLTVFKTVALILIIYPGFVILAKGKTQNFNNMFDIETDRLEMLPLALYSGLYAYAGWYFLNLVREEVQNPKRNIPLALSSSMVVVTVLYLLVNVSYFAMMTPVGLRKSESVAATFYNRKVNGVAFAVPILVAMSVLGALNGVIFGTSRIVFVGAREGHWPILFSMIHIQRRTPLPALMIMYPMAVVMIIIGEIYQLLNFVSFSHWLFISLSALGMIIHRYRFPGLDRPFKVPLIFVVVFFLISLFLLGLTFYATPLETAYSFGICLTGVPPYFLFVYRFHLPKRYENFFNSLSKKLQIFLEVTQQEILTY